MTAPSAPVRALMLARDQHRCVSCSEIWSLEAQHRQAVGMGGSDIKPTIVELVTACTICNGRFEGVLQSRALAFGWKVRSWVKDASLVPVFYRPDHTWFLLAADGTRTAIAGTRAEAQMRAVYGPEWDGWRAAA